MRGKISLGAKVLLWAVVFCLFTGTGTAVLILCLEKSAMSGGHNAQCN